MIVVAGEALIDLVPETAGAATAPLLPARGGGPYNTAVALARLGSRAAFCSRVSDDAFGASLYERLREENVDVGLVQRGPEPTTLALAAVAADGSAAYSFYCEGTADRLFEVPGELPADTRALSFGTCSLVLEPGASAYEELMRREATRGRFVALDPNIRAGLIPDADAYRERFRGWLPSVSLLKLSEEDADWLGNDIDAWLAAGPAAVVVTRGGDGLTAHTKSGESHRVPGERVRVADTIGAGDTVNAALLHTLEQRDLLSAGALAALPGDVWREVLGFAARAAAITCSRPGAEPPYAHEVPDAAGAGPGAH
ncbi:carbohydrate kinase [Streptomyces triticagri]|uniref:Carbohydrate kinase n=1 Tax=Streptomyces triticagri TaxID=2293568 RepID=A0A372LVC5_9ACTN|nr:carbohydrate kinase [Streptomyces triticagri]RFU82618.1 carbohydrate kinase [Streptomyces triticagri]